MTALLGARLDRLPAAERSLLEHASIIGLEVTREEVASLLGSSDLSELLASLTRKTLLRKLSTRRGEMFAFRHVLVREAAYDGLSKKQRAVLHERYADRLLEHHGDTGGEIQAFVAHHLEQAAQLRRDLAPGAAGVIDLEARATKALAAAAEHATHTDDNASACALFERSLALMPANAPARRRRLLELSWARSAMASTALAREAVEEGLALTASGAPSLDHQALLVQRTLLQMEAVEQVDLDLALQLSQRAVEASEAAGDIRVRCHALELQIHRYSMLGQWGPVPELAEEIMRIGLPAERSQAWLLRLSAFQFGPTPYSRLLALTAAEDLSRSPIRMRASVHGRRAVALAALGNPADAEAELAAGQADDLAGRSPGASNMALAQVRLFNGDRIGAMEPIRDSVEAHRRSGGLTYASSELGLLAALLAEQGDDVGAAAAVAEAASVTSPDDVWSMAQVTGVGAVLAARKGDLAQADLLAQECMAVIDGTDALVLRGDLHRWLAEVAGLRGDIAGQRRLLGEALTSYREKEHRTFAALTERALAALD